MRVLLMEDDVPLGMELARALRQANHDVTLTTNASEARLELWHWDYDLLITDMIVRREGRPVPDGGLGLISWVRHTAATMGLVPLPIIAMSAEHGRPGMDFLLPTAAQVGANVVLEKPVDLDDLLLRIELLVEDKTPRTVITDASHML